MSEKLILTEDEKELIRRTRQQSKEYKLLSSNPYTEYIMEMEDDKIVLRVKDNISIHGQNQRVATFVKGDLEGIQRLFNKLK